VTRRLEQRENIPYHGLFGVEGAALPKQAYRMHVYRATLSCNGYGQPLRRGRESGR
jgi:hypothetical protein